MRGKQREIILNIIAILIGCLFLFPLYFIIVSSLKTEAEIFVAHPTIFPKKITFLAYTAQFTGGDYNIFRGFINSSIVAFSTMVISILLSVPSAYGLARYKIIGKKIFIYMFLLTQLMPATLLLAPMYIMFKNFGVLNTFIPVILANCTTAIPFCVIMLRPYFLSLPKELDEAAKIDGCSSFKAFIKIMVPIGYPGIIMGAIFSFLFAWGDLIYSLTFISDVSKRPITAGIYNFLGKYGTQWNKIMAFGTVIMVPVILIFIFCQKYIIGGLTNGAVKE